MITLAKIFEGIRILDLSQFLSGPWGSTFLVDNGAEVIKVEPPASGEQFRFFTIFNKKIFGLLSIYNRGKKSITLDLRVPDGQDILKKIVKSADVV